MSVDVLKWTASMVMSHAKRISVNRQKPLESSNVLQGKPLGQQFYFFASLLGILI
jgi:hypothetical protein